MAVAPIMPMPRTAVFGWYKIVGLPPRIMLGGAERVGARFTLPIPG